MKKLFYFAAAAMMMAACTSEELNVQETQQAVQDNAAVNFDVYVNRGVTRAGTPNDIDNTNIGKIGFGVFAYYTNDTQYGNSATPNFMYNQKVITSDNPATTSSVWTYEPVKYWPNEYGDAAISDEIDYVSFFSYAPWTEVEPTTGKPKTVAPTTENPETVQHQQDYNIIGVSKNTATGDPIVKYVVDTDPKTSVDLLWGVKADGSTETSIANPAVPSPELGMPFVDLTKPADPVAGKIRFNLKHALAKLKVTIDYIDDAETPAGPAAGKLKADETRIYVRWLEINGFALKGALNLNNDEPNKPNWKDIEGLKELEFPDAIRFNDGRKDAKEGTQNGAANNELNIRLNPEIVENFASTKEDAETHKITFGTDKKPGVTATPQLLFGGDETVNGGYFYVIPRNLGEQVDVKINYDVLTLDPSLATTLSGTKDFGSEIENQIEKQDIFKGLDFEPGKVYTIKIHLGMTSVKFEATVEEWKNAENGQPDVDLPDNQADMAYLLGNAVDYNYSDYTYTGEFTVDETTDPVTIAYNPGTATTQQMMNDFARILGALHRASGVNQITFQDKLYVWDEARGALINGGAPMKGSNFVLDEDGGTPQSLVNAVVIAYASMSFPITISTDKGDFQIALDN
jgi:hypothetical protein